MEKQRVIDNLYSAFRRYNTSDMHHCDCGCIDLKDVKRLASKPLRNLEEADFSSYHGSALYTWGDLRHYKHFLPRILEVHNLLNGRGLIGLYEITAKLKYAEWETWKSEEVKAIKNFIIIDWIELVHHKEINIEADDFEYYTFLLGSEDLLKYWRVTESVTGLKKLVDFLYHYGEEAVYQRILKNIASINHLTQKLEETFFNVTEIDGEYAERISIVLQMIETIVAIQKDI